MSVMTYTCSQCGDTGRDVLDIVNNENYCQPCLEGQMSIIKEIDEAMVSLWWQYEISDEAKMWWNDFVTQLINKKGEGQ